MYILMNVIKGKEGFLLQFQPFNATWLFLHFYLNNIITWIFFHSNPQIYDLCPNQPFFFTIDLTILYGTIIKMM
jgi:hypothetical protein